MVYYLFDNPLQAVKNTFYVSLRYTNDQIIAKTYSHMRSLCKTSHLHLYETTLYFIERVAVGYNKLWHHAF